MPRRRMTALGALLCAVMLEGCGCATYSNRLWAGRRPHIGSVVDETDFMSEPATALPCHAKILGFLTTPFKRLGVFGWRDMQRNISVSGEVVQAAYSTDHYVTIDIRLREAAVDGASLRLTTDRYLRAEICERRLSLPKTEWPRRGDHVRVTGRLMWDGDGFLEVHPQRREQVAILMRSPDVEARRCE